jgi:hypothetical protein
MHNLCSQYHSYGSICPEHGIELHSALLINTQYNHESCQRHSIVKYLYVMNYSFFLNIFIHVNLIYKSTGSAPHDQYGRGLTENVNFVYIVNDVYKKKAASFEAALFRHINYAKSPLKILFLRLFFINTDTLVIFEAILLHFVHLINQELLR